MFDGIAYGKASDVLLTVENYLGEETFRKGVHNYLAAHRVLQCDCRRLLERSRPRPATSPSTRSWRAWSPSPVCRSSPSADPVDGKVAVTQKRFFLSPSVQTGAGQKWTLPVCFKNNRDNQDCAVLTPAVSTLSVPAAAPFFANAGGKGYYRTAYSPAAYNAILANIESALTPSERISFIGDEWAQVRSNKASIGKYLDLVAAVKDDPNADVVSSALGGYEAAYSRIAASAEEKSALQAWVRSTFEPVYARLGPPSDTDSPSARELRSTLFATLGNAKDPAILAEARNIAYKYIANPASVDGTFAQTALAVAARNGDSALFDKLQKLYETSTDPEIQIGALRLLAVFENPELVKRALDYAISDKVRNQDAAIQLAIPVEADESRDQAWKYIQAHWEKVQAQLTTNSGSILIGSTSGFCSSSGREDVERFFSAHKVAASGQSLKHAIEHIDGCIELRALQEPQLKSWLTTQQRTASGAAMH